MNSTPVVSVVDDDEQVRESLAALIQSMDVEVEAYASGREFLDHYNPAQPGCIVLDLRMPQLSGQEVIDELNADRVTYESLCAEDYLRASGGRLQ